MPTKRRDPVVAVLKYFEEAELALAQQALSLATARVKARVTPAARPRPRAVKPIATAAPAAVASAAGATD